MELSDAIRLVEKGIATSASSQRWADLGAGSGLFTMALASRLPAQSMLLAVDSDQRSMRSIPKEHNGVLIQTATIDFVKQLLPVEPVDGILMANSLHYVKDKSAFVDKLLKVLKPDGRLIIVEYETSSANTWVPYPITFDSLSSFLKEKGFSEVQQIGRQPSAYHSGGMYAALALQ